MKTKFTLLLVCVLLGSLRAQLLNGSFETTVAVQNPYITNKIDTLPQSWVVASSFGSRVSNVAHSGLGAVVLWSWYYGQANGSMVYGTSYFNNGLPFNDRPLALTGYYKFLLVNSKNGLPDSALINLFLTKWNTTSGKRDTVADAEIHLGASASYQQFSTLIHYKDQSIPDTLLVYSRSSYNQWTNCDKDGFGNCNYLYLDDLALTMPVGFKEVEKNSSSFYPNPASDHVHIINANESYAYIIFDALGQQVLSGTAFRKPIDVSELPRGVYFIQLKRDSGFSETKRLVKE